MEQVLEQLNKEFPKQLNYFHLDPNNVEVLSDPSVFYNLLLKCIDSSQKRIVISALYLGTGEQETLLVDAIERKLKSVPTLKVEVYFDYNRSLRKNPDGRKSVMLLQRLMTYPNIKFTFYKHYMPIDSLLKPLSLLSARIREVGSILHAKAFIFDDDIIVSGANLSEIYFKNRQDRYVHIKNSAKLTNFLVDLLRCLNSQHNSAKSIETLNKFMSPWNKLPGSQKLSTVAIPIVQHGPLELNQDLTFMSKLHIIIGSVPRSIRLSSGYFNPIKSIEKIVENVDILVPSKGANGFGGATGFGGFIPSAYNYFYRDFLKNVKCKSFSLYERPGWTYHAKGLWVDCMPKFFLTSVGSSNYNYRSYHRDFEFQLIILTKDERLASKFSQESDNLWSKARLIEKFNDVPVVRPYVRILAKMFRSFL